MKRKWISYAIAFLVIITVNFVAPRMLPGDPISAVYGDEVLINLPEEAREYISSRYDLDKPVFVQYFLYIYSIFKGNLGYSIYYKKSVIQLLLGYIPYTIVLMGLAMIISTIIAIIIGIESGWRRGSRLDRYLLSTLIFSSGFPGFFIGALLLIIFGIILGILPFQGARTLYSGMEGLMYLMDFLRHLILPVISLVLVYLPPNYLLTRNSVIANIREPYVLLARAKGLNNLQIRYRHVGRNSLIPVTTQTGIRLGTMIVTGSLFIEIVYSYPGMGTLIYNSILNRDYPVLQGSFLFVAVLVLLINFIVDIFYVKLDPRIKYA
jgi:peptide/nickel transport system permease protein